MYICHGFSHYLHFSHIHPSPCDSHIYRLNLSTVLYRHLFPPTQPGPRIITLLLSRSSTLRIPPWTSGMRTLREVTIILLRRRSRWRRRRNIALRHILSPLILLLLLRRLTPRLMLLMLRRGWGEELLVRWRGDGVVLVLCRIVTLTRLVLVLRLSKLLV